MWCKNFNARTKMDDPWVGSYAVVQCVGRRHLDLVDRTGRKYRTHMRNTKRVHDLPF